MHSVRYVTHVLYQAHGQYHALVQGKDILQWLVVDIRNIDKGIHIRDEHLVHVRYNDAMTEFVAEWAERLGHVREEHTAHTCLRTLPMSTWRRCKAQPRHSRRPSTQTRL